MLAGADRTPAAEQPGAAAAQAASLSYVSDTEPGIRRRAAGGGFSYLDAKGRKITHAPTLDRIAKLAVPPAWTDVWISPDADGHIQATGRDARGRKQYRYHGQWTACRDEVKYSSLVAFATALPAIRKKVDSDLHKKGLPREKVVASIVWLLDNAMIRVGNESYARDNNSFGLATLRDRHVKVGGSSLQFAFKGKSGKEWRLKVSDRRIARVVRGAQDLPGQHLFQFLKEDGSRGSVTSQDVNAYIRDSAGADFSSKHFRTWGGTVRAARLLAETPLPETKSGAARAMNEVIDQVARKLGNTRAVCRRCYVHPAVISAWSDGFLKEGLMEVARRYRRTPAGLDRDEAVTLRWLEQQQG